MTDNQVDQGEEGISGEAIIQTEKKKDLFCSLIFCFVFFLPQTVNSVNYVFMCILGMYLA